MPSIKSGFIYLAILLVILSIATQEVEGRRLVLKGRRTITRHYYRGLAIPAWLIIVLIGVADLIIGGVLYIVMNRFVLRSSAETSNTYQPAMMDDV